MARKEDSRPSKRYLEVFLQREIQGRSIESVAKEFGIKPKSVSDFCYFVRRYMRRHGAHLVMPDPSIGAIINAREMYLARLEHQWQELMQEWYRSQQPQESNKTTQSKLGDRETRRVEHTIKHRTGDVRYLELALQILLEIRLICLDRPYVPQEENRARLHDLKLREMEFRRLLAENGQAVAEAADDGGAAGPGDSTAAA